ncbi:MAG: IS66 family transposase [Rhodomicrobium sp.]
MLADAVPVPENYDELRAFALALHSKNALLETALDARDTLLKERDAEILVYKDEVYAKTLHIEKLKAQLAVLRRARFGRSSEKLNREIEQLELAIDDAEESQAHALLEREAKLQALGLPASRPAQAVEAREEVMRRAFPDHLPRERVEHRPDCICPSCGGTRLRQIGIDEREMLEYVPSHFKVIVHARPKMACRDCEAITQKPMPSLPIVRGIPGPALLAHMLIAKYADHLPLYRQSVIYARSGVKIERSTMADWVGQMAFLLTPLVDAVAGHVRGGETLHVDDTPIPVLDPGRKCTKKGRLWVAVRDERSWGSTAPPAVYYQYAPDRTKARPQALLQGANGYLHADAYSGFEHLYEPDKITGACRFKEVSCWAHARRHIYDVHVKEKSPRALELLEAIGTLFQIEAAIKGQSPEQRLAVRQQQSVPLLAALKARFDETLGQTTRKGNLAKAILYITVRWEAMTRYTTDGRLDIDNNAAERAIRPIAIGRRNWTFAGSDDGGERAAMIFTLIESAKMNGLDPEAYLRDVIGRIADHPINKIGELLPWNFKPQALQSGKGT